MMSWAIISIVALYSNRESKSSLFLCGAALLNTLFPAFLITNYYIWYLIVFLLEFVVIYFSYKSTEFLALPLLLIHGCLIVFHVSHLLSYSPTHYYYLVQSFEYMSGICCILFSNPILTKIKESIWKFQQ